MNRVMMFALIGMVAMANPPQPVHDSRCYDECGDFDQDFGDDDLDCANDPLPEQPKETEVNDERQK